MEHPRKCSGNNNRPASGQASGPTISLQETVLERGYETQDERKWQKPESRYSTDIQDVYRLKISTCYK